MGSESIDLTGKTFRDWIVIERANREEHRSGYWLCKCKCGNVRAVSGSRLIRKETHGCVNCRSTRIVSLAKDMVGQTFGFLTVIKLDAENKTGRAKWICQCQCGNVVSVMGTNLRSKGTRSCGCYIKLINSNHRLSRHPLYSRWKGINGRCNKKNHDSYLYYGGRGISLYQEWCYEKYNGPANNMGAINFIRWAESQAAKQGISLYDLYNKKYGNGTFWSLDRIDNNLGYTPENCKWATRQEQNVNVRKRLKNDEVDILLKERDSKIKKLQKELRKLKKIYGL